MFSNCRYSWGVRVRTCGERCNVSDLDTSEVSSWPTGRDTGHARARIFLVKSCLNRPNKSFSKSMTLSRHDIVSRCAQNMFQNAQRAALRVAGQATSGKHDTGRKNAKNECSFEKNKH